MQATSLPVITVYRLTRLSWLRATNFPSGEIVMRLGLLLSILSSEYSAEIITEASCHNEHIQGQKNKELALTWPLVYSMAELNTFQVPSFDTVATLLESEEKEKLYTPLVCPV